MHFCPHSNTRASSAETQTNQSRKGQIVPPTCFSTLSSRARWGTCGVPSLCHPARPPRSSDSPPFWDPARALAGRSRDHSPRSQSNLNVCIYILTDTTNRLSIMFWDFFQMHQVDRNVFKKAPAWSPVSHFSSLYSVVNVSAGNLTTDNKQP